MLAALVLAVHLLIIAFNLFGMIAIPLSAWRGWRFVHAPVSLSEAHHGPENAHRFDCQPMCCARSRACIWSSTGTDRLTLRAVLQGDALA
jgi:hypothetical protein